MPNVRMPTQKRSIEKRNRIIEKGFELICEKGYYNTNTAEIAEYASVSTGIIYQYFNDKRDIFIEGTKDYADKIMFPMLGIIDNKDVDKKNIREVFVKMIDSYIKTHTIKKEPHEELMAMSCLDKDIANIFNDREMLLTMKVSSILIKGGFNDKNIEEKVHLLIGIIDNYCHEVVYHKHKDLNYDVMKDELLDIIVNFLD